MKKILVIIFILCGINELAADATGILTGRVRDKTTQSPISGVTVSLQGTRMGTYTSSDGSYKIEEIPPGVYSVKFRSLGYEEYIQSDVVINSGRPASLDAELSETVIRLEGAEVRGSYFPKKVETATSTQSLNSEDIRRAPGVQEDVLRATALLPGVNVTAAGRNDLIVRGGAPFENLFIVDNLEVNNINHFGSQGSTGGPLSIINLDFVKNVEFSAGGFGAKYGDKLSSLTNITLRNGNEEKFGGKANLSATGFGLNLEGPINDKGSFLLSARRSYLDLIFNAAGFGFVPEYWDFQGKVNYSADNKNIFTLLSVWALGSVKLNNDDADNRLDNSRVAVPNQRQYFSGLTWKHLFDKGFTTVTLGRNYTNFSTFQNDSSEVPKEIFRNDSEEGELILRTDLDLQLAERTELRIGNQVKYGAALDYDINLPGYLRRDENGEPRPLLLDTTFNTYKNGTYASLTLPLSDHRVTFGGRMDYYSYTGNKFFFSPRASFSYYINPVSSIIGSAGRYYQAPSYVWLIGGAREALEPVIADQVVLGYDHTPTQDVKVQLEVFYKWYDNYPARIFRPQAVLAPAGFDDITGDIPFGLEPLASRGDGLSRGAELFIQKKLSNIPVYGLLSLSYSETKFTSLDGVKRWGAFDSRWVFNIAGGWRVSPDWEISGKFRIATGVPTTPYTEDGRLDFTRYNEGERLPLFHSFDFRADKKWNFVGWSLVTYIDVQNVYGRENISGIKWNPRLGEPEFQKSIGVLPSIGVSFEF